MKIHTHCIRQQINNVMLQQPVLQFN